MFEKTSFNTLNLKELEIFWVLKGCLKDDLKFHSLYSESISQVKLVRCCPEDDDFVSTFDEELSVYRKYQTVIHKDDPDDVDERQVCFCQFLHLE